MSDTDEPKTLNRITAPWGDTILHDPQDRGLDQDMIATGVWWPRELDVLARITPTGGVVLDIGASLGYLTCFFAHHVGPRGRVHAIEPSPRMVGLLRTNANLNGHYNVTVGEFAMGSVSGHVDLWQSATHLGRHSLISDNVPMAVDPVRIPVEKVDQYWHRAMGAGAVDVLKVDVEGAEHAVLSGATELLGVARHVWIEVWVDGLVAAGADALQVHKLLRSHGFQITYWNLVNGNSRTVDSDREFATLLAELYEWIERDGRPLSPILYALASRNSSADRRQS